MNPTLPYLYVPPDTPITPLVVSVPHAGTWVPAEDLPLVRGGRRTLLRDTDQHVDRLYAAAPLLGAAFIASRVNRYVLDLNRSPDNVDRHVCPELESPAAEHPRALIWRQSTDGTQILARPLTQAELQSRIDRVHTPYHSFLESLLQERKSKFGYAILLDAHSMPSVGRATHTDTGAPRAQIVPGNNHDKSCAPALTELVCRHFESHGYDVALNTPYSGGFITQNYGRPEENIHAIQVELNRALYLHEERSSWAGEKAPALIECLNQLIVQLVGLNLS
ncbi:MAG TPA: N-formylglutamate amidohydrolase [Myxococcales bacterium]|nr:N-formylglutamate amidohydrolase [Myxococcales bacterium]